MIGSKGDLLFRIPRPARKRCRPAPRPHAAMPEMRPRCALRRATMCGRAARKPARSAHRRSAPRGSPNALWTEGLPRRVPHRRNREGHRGRVRRNAGALWRRRPRSTAPADVAAGSGNGQTEPWTYSSAAGKTAYRRARRVGGATYFVSARQRAVCRVVSILVSNPRGSPALSC